MIPTTIPAAAPTEIARVLVAWLEVSCANAPVLCRGGKDGSEAPGGDGMGGSGKGGVDGGSGGGGYGGGAEIPTGGNGIGGVFEAQIVCGDSGISGLEERRVAGNIAKSVHQTCPLRG